MKQVTSGVLLTTILFSSFNSMAKTPSRNNHSSEVPYYKEYNFDDDALTKQKSSWGKLKRKLASDMTFSTRDLSPDYIRLRDEWLKVTTGQQLDDLLKRTQTQYELLSEDTKYFVSQLQQLIPLRGIVWRTRPLFENSKGLFGNKSTHVSAVQFLRMTFSSFKSILPTDQTDAFIEYITEPSVEMTKKHQFQTVSDFQNFLMTEVIPQLQDSIENLEKIARDASNKVFVWDNKMIFGKGSFEDEIQRYKGHGPAEINIAIAGLYRASHNILVYCAYNQDYSIKLLGEIGSHLGVDSSFLTSKNKDLGMTDEERIKLVKNAIKNHRFLELRNYQGTQYGSSLMKQAYITLKNSTVYAERSHSYLEGQDSSRSMVINPILFQEQLSPHLDKGIKNMRAIVSGPTEVRDPVTAETVTVHLSPFYKNPLPSLGPLLPIKFEDGEIEKTIKNKYGETLKVRNYLKGRSIAWDNNVWKTYVPSAEGKNPNYMSEARRIIDYSFGSGIVFGLPKIFVD